MCSQVTLIYYCYFFHRDAIVILIVYGSSSPGVLSCLHVFSQPFLKHVVSFCCMLVFRLRGFSDGGGRVPDVLEPLEMDN